MEPDQVISNDPTGQIAQCIGNLINAGFDAPAIEMARNAGVFVLAIVVIAPILVFVVRALRGTDTPPIFSDGQFRLLLLAAVIMIALPLVIKFAGHQFEVELASDDRNFAQQICEAQFDAGSSTAEIEALNNSVRALATRVASFETAVLEPVVIEAPMPVPTTPGAVAPTALAPVRPLLPVPSPEPEPEPDPNAGPAEPAEQPIVVVRPEVSPLLGVAVSVFHRDPRTGDATRVADLLKQEGAGVSQKESSLTEVVESVRQQPGATVILYGGGFEDEARAARTLLEDTGTPVEVMAGPVSLRGNPVQILMF